MPRQSYIWTDAGAPQLSGTVGSGLAWLRALLVGSGGIAYGLKPALGWTEEYTGTNEACFRNSMAEGGSGCYLQVLDTNATYTQIRMYESMSDLTTGSAPTAQYLIQKSSTANGTPRPWQFEGSGVRFFTTVLGGHTANPAPVSDYLGWTTFAGGGNYKSYYPGDPAVFCTGRVSAGEWVDSGPLANAGGVDLSAPTGNFATLTRDNALSIAATATAGMRLTYATAGSGGYGVHSQVSTLPSPGSGALGNQYTPFILTTNNAVRGYIPGLFAPLNVISATKSIIGDIDTPIATSSPRTLRIMGSGYALANQIGLLAFDSGEWDA